MSTEKDIQARDAHARALEHLTEKAVAAHKQGNEIGHKVASGLAGAVADEYTRLSHKIEGTSEPQE
jgi:hypothetical protein